MDNLPIAMAGLTAIILFVFGLDNFSKEIERISGERFRKFLSRSTRIPVVGVLLGAMVTAIIQSSSATSVIAISLVNAGVLSFKSSVGIIFGANIGTTITAQLVAFKLTAYAPIFIIAGFILSMVRSRYSFFGKAIFYFGFVFFSLNLISSSLAPLQNDPGLVRILTQPQNPFYAILFGCLFTAVVQSSSVTTGLAIIFTQQGILGLENAVPLIMGANIGTTATALLAVINMDISAKKAALAHFLFNVGGVLLFLPLLLLFGARLQEVQVAPAIALANIHLVFNVVTSLVFVVLITPFTRLVELILGEGKMDFERLQLPVFDESSDFDSIQAKLREEIDELMGFVQENYNAVTLSIETNYQGIYDVAEKRIEYVEFVKNEYQLYFARVVAKITEEEHSRQLIRIINRFDYLLQIHDSIKDLFSTKRVMNEHYIELKSDILLVIRDLSSQTLVLFDQVHRSIGQPDSPETKKLAREVQSTLDEAHRKLLRMLTDPRRRDAGALINFVTYSQRLKDKLVNFAAAGKKSKHNRTSEAAALEETRNAAGSPGDELIAD